MARQAARKRDAQGQVTGRSARVEHRAGLPVRRYGNSQGDGIAADRTACGAMPIEGAWQRSEGMNETAELVSGRARSIAVQPSQRFSRPNTSALDSRSRWPVS